MNEYRHFYLYAKHHYKHSDDIIEDLKHILGQYVGSDIKYLHATDIANKLLEITGPHIRESQHHLEAFISDIFHQADLYRGKLFGPQMPVETVDLIRAMLSILEFTCVYDDQKKVILELGEPDPKVLPIAEKKG